MKQLLPCVKRQLMMWKNISFNFSCIFYELFQIILLTVWEYKVFLYLVLNGDCRSIISVILARRIRLVSVGGDGRGSSLVAFGLHHHHHRGLVLLLLLLLLLTFGSGGSNFDSHRGENQFGSKLCSTISILETSKK